MKVLIANRGEIARRIERDYPQRVIDSRLATTIPNDKPYVLACYSGQSAGHAKIAMELMGYDQVYSLLFGMAERYFLTGDKQWFQRHRARLQAAADWIIRQRNSYMKDVPNRQDLLVAGLMPPYMLGDYALPASDWRWYYCDNAFSLQGLQRFADALAEFDAEAGRKYRDEAEAFRGELCLQKKLQVHAYGG